MTQQITRQTKLTRQDRLERLSADFPAAVRPLLLTLPQTHGRLEGADCRRMLAEMGIAIEALMLALLPLARLFAVAPISTMNSWI